MPAALCALVTAEAKPAPGPMVTAARRNAEYQRTHATGPSTHNGL